MSDRSQVVPTPEGEYFESARFSGLSVILGIVAILGLALSLIGAVLSPETLPSIWLLGFAFIRP